MYRKFRLIRIGVVKYERTEEEKHRRRLYGDAGARFKYGKCMRVDMCGICPSVTTFCYHDISLIEIYESR